MFGLNILSSVEYAYFPHAIFNLTKTDIHIQFAIANNLKGNKDSHSHVKGILKML